MPIATIQCPKCNSKNIVARRDKQSYCRRCGFIGATSTFRDGQDALLREALQEEIEEASWREDNEAKK